MNDNKILEQVFSVELTYVQIVNLMYVAMVGFEHERQGGGGHVDPDALSGFKILRDTVYPQIEE